MPNADVIGFTGYGHDVANAAAEDVASEVLEFLALTSGLPRPDPIGPHLEAVMFRDRDAPQTLPLN
jgi:hypothetical protein